MPSRLLSVALSCCGAIQARVWGAEGVTFWLQIKTALRDTLGPPLKALNEPIDRWLGSLPMSVAVASAVGLYVIALIWTWCLKKDFIFRGAPDRRPWRDLRIWATIVIVPYIVIYCWIGR